MQFSNFIKIEFETYYKQEIDKYLSTGEQPYLTTHYLIQFIQNKINEFKFESEELSVLYKILLTNKEQALLLINSFNFKLQEVALKFKSKTRNLDQTVNNLAQCYSDSNEYFFVRYNDIESLKNKESEILIESLKTFLDKKFKTKTVAIIYEFAIESTIFKQIKQFLKENNYVYTFGGELSYSIKIAKKPIGLFNNIKYRFSWR